MRRKRVSVELLVIVAGLLLLLSSTTLAGQFCKADCNGDCKVNLTDLVTMKSEFLYPDCEACSPPYPAPVEKSGQSTCYDENNIQRDCSGTGEDGEYQSGVSWPEPRFTDNLDATVTDNVTGLMWLKDANCMATSYPGFDNDEITFDGKVTWQHALDFVAGINDGTYGVCGAGYTDWKLANVNELLSLIDRGQYDPALSSGYPFSNVQSDDYWSSNTSSSGDGGAWYVRMLNGYTNGKTKSADYYVWPVRGPE